MKKLLSIIMVLTLVLSLGVTAFAVENTGSITITNATIGNSYSLYKIFDATYSTDTSGNVDAVSYSIAKDNQFFSYMFGVDGKTENAYFIYDAETGAVTITANLMAGNSVDIDFYTDGVFDYELTPEMCEILAQCIGLKWFNRNFGNDWLGNMQKIKDKSFDVGSVSAQMTSVTARKKELRLALNDRLLHFEQNVTMRQGIPSQRKLAPPPLASTLPSTENGRLLLTVEDGSIATASGD